MRLSRFSPCEQLQPFIKEYLIIESEQEVSNTILPDTSLVMSFRYDGEIWHKEGNIEALLPVTVISGLRKSTRNYTYSGKTANLLVVFGEGGLSAFSALPAHELFSYSVETENIFQSSLLNEMIERLNAAASHPGRIEIMESFLIGHLRSGKPDELIGNAIQLIKQQHGIVKIRELACSLHISQDAFEKRFRSRVGSSPKQFASIIRLRHIIETVKDYHSLTDACYEAGYFDQSHFIRDFKSFTGSSPSQFFRNRPFW